jgi:hypothetical protein
MNQINNLCFHVESRSLICSSISTVGSAESPVVSDKLSMLVDFGGTPVLIGVDGGAVVESPPKVNKRKHTRAIRARAANGLACLL